jgi:hypothetical protein
LDMSKEWMSTEYLNDYGTWRWVGKDPGADHECGA